MKIWVLTVLVVGIACQNEPDQSSLPDSERIEGHIVKISRDSIYLKNKKPVYFRGLTSGSGKYVFLTRHAQKDTIGMDPGLSGEGEATATRLASILQSTPLKQIYNTHFRRVYLTVRPLSELKTIGLQRYEPGDQQTLVDDLVNRDEGVYVVCGHSNSIPQLIGLLGGTPPKIDEDQYEEIWLVEMNEKNTISKFTY